MNSLYYTLSAPSLKEQVDTVIYEDLRVFKGTTSITYDLQKLYPYSHDIIKLTIDFGDGSIPIVKNYRFDDITDQNLEILKKPIIHEYIPRSDVDYVVYYPTLTMRYSNFKTLTIEMPIRLSRPSYYTEYRNLTISSIQFIDDENDSIFTTLQTANGDILNLKIK